MWTEVWQWPHLGCTLRLNSPTESVPISIRVCRTVLASVPWVFSWNIFFDSASRVWIVRIVPSLTMSRCSAAFRLSWRLSIYWFFCRSIFVSRTWMPSVCCLAWASFVQHLSAFFSTSHPTAPILDVLILGIHHLLQCSKRQVPLCQGVAKPANFLLLPCHLARR